MKVDSKVFYMGEVIAPLLAALPSLTDTEFKAVYATMLKATYLAAERGALCEEYTEIVNRLYAHTVGHTRSKTEAAKDENEDHTGSV